MVKGLVCKLNDTNDSWLYVDEKSGDCVIELRELAIRKHYDPMVHRAGLRIQVNAAKLKEFLCDTLNTQHTSTHQEKQDTVGQATTNK